MNERRNNETRWRLQGVHDGRLLGSEFRKIYRETTESEFEHVGTLPIPETGRSGFDYRLKTGRYWKTLVSEVVGTFSSVNVWPVTDTDLVASADRWLFVSHDGGVTWDVSHELPASSSPMGILPSAFCHHDGALYVGEYPLDTSVTPRLLRSDDGGDTWSTALALDDVRHFHSVQHDPHTDELWLTTGDTDDESRIGRFRDGRFEVVGGGSQRWRAVQLAFTPEAVLWGMDSVYTPEKPILRLDRDRSSRSNPSLETVHTVSSSVYYSATLEVDGDQWVAFSTAAESGPDSTGPDRQAVHTGEASVIAASSASGFTDWRTLVSYGRRRVLADRWNPKGFAPIAGAYVYIAADPDRGLFVNPYNTDDDDGSLLNFPRSYFADRSITCIPNP